MSKEQEKREEYSSYSSHSSWMLTVRNSPLHSLHDYDSITYSVCRPLTNQSTGKFTAYKCNFFPEILTHLVFYHRALKLPGLLVLPIRGKPFSFISILMFHSVTLVF